MAASVVTPLTDEDLERLGFVDDEDSIDNLLKRKNAYSSDLDLNAYIVGWEKTISWNPVAQRIFSKQTVRTIQQKVSEYLAGVDEKGRRIIPSDSVVVNALFGVYRHHRPEEVGDIYGKYLVANPTARNDIAYIIDKTISLLVRGIRDETETIQNNEKLTVWTTLLGDFNEHGLRQYPPIKTREKRPDNFLFHMRY